ncbi:MAG TPA: hypothetical protein EYG85_11885 [Crocinitomix sp.]|nr:hypothetical protein [Crocinitomix sp.]
MIKDVSEEQTASPLGSLLLSSVGSESMNDAMLLEVYVNSFAMFNILDKEFNLTKYYSSDSIDYFNRLSINALLPMYETTLENLLAAYINDLSIVIDEASGTMEIAFAHANPERARKIVQFIVNNATKTLNIFEKKNSEVVLRFLEKQEKEKYKFFINSVKQLLIYQNRHNTINPEIEIKAKGTIVAGLESELIQKNVEYNSKSKYLNKSSPEMKILKGNIEYVQKSIEELKREITGTNGKDKLNVNMSDFTLLQSRVEFNKQVYIQTLIKLEETKVLVKQNTKNIIIVSDAQIPDSYTYPNKIKDSISVFIIISFLYGIIGLIFTLIRDHKD